MPDVSSNRSRQVTRLALAVVGAWLLVACRRQPTILARPWADAWPTEEHCWWAAYRTPLPPDSVADRFSRAFARSGLSDVRAGTLGDTAWSQAGPTTLGDSTRARAYAMRVVAI